MTSVLSRFLDLPFGVRFPLLIIQRINDTRPRLAIDMEFSGTSSRGHTSLDTIHGFRVQSYGKRVSPGFKRGLRRLAERGFDDPTCVVVKTASGNRSGITHAGGRYVPPDSTYRTEVMREMRNLGMEPPPPPFIVAPGEYTLYHEWGHHVDRTWSGDSHDVRFSFRRLSRFYQLGARPSRAPHVGHGYSVDYDDIWPIESDGHAANAVVVWWHASSELFADLFEDWMRGEKKVGWDQCEPQSLNAPASRGHPSVRIAIFPQECEPKMSARKRTPFSRVASNPRPTFRQFGQICSVRTRTKWLVICARSSSARGRAGCDPWDRNTVRPAEVAPRMHPSGYALMPPWRTRSRRRVCWGAGCGRGTSPFLIRSVFGTLTKRMDR